mmetsp:Transcript_24393/g.35830  ORF Transcript_24393/g.35830 Transcript_24393/m.35830 type:complete len:104 (-) Transcript_24393:385-696(-)
MNKAVHCCTKETVATSLDLTDEKPCPDEHNVVVTMKKRNLIILLSQDHEQSVQEFDVFVVVVHPNKERDTEGTRSVFRIVSPDASKHWVSVYFMNDRSNTPYI